MNIRIIRGSHEIGGSCIELVSERTHIVIDVGMPLVTHDGQKYSMRDIQNLTNDELVARNLLPDVRNLFSSVPGFLPVSGLLISHAHQDHYGFLNRIQPGIPVFLGNN